MASSFSSTGITRVSPSPSPRTMFSEALPAFDASKVKMWQVAATVASSVSAGKV